MGEFVCSDQLGSYVSGGVGGGGLSPWKCHPYEIGRRLGVKRKLVPDSSCWGLGVWQQTHIAKEAERNNSGDRLKKYDKDIEFYVDIWKAQIKMTDAEND